MTDATIVWQGFVPVLLDGSFQASIPVSDGRPVSFNAEVDTAGWATASPDAEGCVYQSAIAGGSSVTLADGAAAPPILLVAVRPIESGICHGAESPPTSSVPVPTLPASTADGVPAPAPSTPAWVWLLAASGCAGAAVGLTAIARRQRR